MSSRLVFSDPWRRANNLSPFISVLLSIHHSSENWLRRLSCQPVGRPLALELTTLSSLVTNFFLHSGQAIAFFRNINILFKAMNTRRTAVTRHSASTSIYSLTFEFALCCHSNATCAPIANPPNTAQLGGIRYQSPKLHPGPCDSVGVRPRTDTQTDTQTRVTTIHFASSTTHVEM